MDNDNGVPLGIVCTPAQYEQSLTASSIYCLTRNDTIALMVGSSGLLLPLSDTRNQAPTLAALVSLFALSFVFAIVLVRLYLNFAAEHV